MHPLKNLSETQGDQKPYIYNSTLYIELNSNVTFTNTFSKFVTVPPPEIKWKRKIMPPGPSFSKLKTLTLKFINPIMFFNQI